MRIILASASPRRKQLLSKIVDNFEIIASNVKEVYPSSLDPLKVPLYISSLKAKDIYSSNKDALVIGCDTAIIFKDKVIGKPLDYNDAKRTLELLSNKMHHVVTGVTVYYKNNKYEINSINEVYFKSLSKSDIESYLETDEYKDKAGSYAIQGKGNALIDHINGDFDSIVGLPTNELKKLLDKLKKGDLE